MSGEYINDTQTVDIHACIEKPAALHPAHSSTKTVRDHLQQIFCLNAVRPFVGEPAHVASFDPTVEK